MHGHPVVVHHRRAKVGIEGGVVLGRVVMLGRRPAVVVIGKIHAGGQVGTVAQVEGFDAGGAGVVAQPERAAHLVGSRLAAAHVARGKRAHGRGFRATGTGGPGRGPGLVSRRRTGWHQAARVLNNGILQHHVAGAGIHVHPGAAFGLLGVDIEFPGQHQRALGGCGLAVVLHYHQLAGGAVGGGGVALLAFQASFGGGIVPHVAAGPHGGQGALQRGGRAQGGLGAESGGHGLKLAAEHAGRAVHRVLAVLHFHAVEILLKPLVALAQFVGFYAQGAQVVGGAQGQLLAEQGTAIGRELAQGSAGLGREQPQLRRAIGR